MTTALAPVQDQREAALLKAVGLDKVPPEQRELALNIAERYGLDLMLKHIQMVEGRPYITRDGLLHIAHRSGVFDGMDVTEPRLEGGYWHATATVYRKDMSRGFTFSGRYPAQGGNAKYAPEMATKTAESHAFRRAFDISAPTVDERWDIEDATAPVERQPVPLAAKVAARRVDIEARSVDVPPEAVSPVSVDPVASGVIVDPPAVTWTVEGKPATEAEVDAAMARYSATPDEAPLPPEPHALRQCPAIGGDKRDQCIRAPGHHGNHDNGTDRWA